jgi:hypothetical protein
MFPLPAGEARAQGGRNRRTGFQLPLPLGGGRNCSLRCMVGSFSLPARRLGWGGSKQVFSSTCDLRPGTGGLVITPPHPGPFSGREERCGADICLLNRERAEWGDQRIGKPLARHLRRMKNMVMTLTHLACHPESDRGSKEGSALGEVFALPVRDYLGSGWRLCRDAPLWGMGVGCVNLKVPLRC